MRAVQAFCHSLKKFNFSEKLTCVFYLLLLHRPTKDHPTRIQTQMSVLNLVSEVEKGQMESKYTASVEY